MPCGVALEPLRSAAKRAGLTALGPSLARTFACFAHRHFFYVDNFRKRQKASTGAKKKAV
jgi:hypothetical protein